MPTQPLGHFGVHLRQMERWIFNLYHVSWVGEEEDNVLVGRAFEDAGRIWLRICHIKRVEKNISINLFLEDWIVWPLTEFLERCQKRTVTANSFIWGEPTRWFYLLLDKRFVAICWHQWKLFLCLKLASILVFFSYFKFIANLQIAPTETFKFPIPLDTQLLKKKRPSHILIYLAYLIN